MWSKETLATNYTSNWVRNVKLKLLKTSEDSQGETRKSLDRKRVYDKEQEKSIKIKKNIGINKTILDE